MRGDRALDALRDIAGSADQVADEVLQMVDQSPRNSLSRIPIEST